MQCVKQLQHWFYCLVENTCITTLATYICSLIAYKLLVKPVAWALPGVNYMHWIKYGIFIFMFSCQVRNSLHSYACRLEDASNTVHVATVMWLFLVHGNLNHICAVFCVWWAVLWKVGVIWAVIAYCDFWAGTFVSINRLCIKLNLVSW